MVKANMYVRLLLTFKVHGGEEKRMMERECDLIVRDWEENNGRILLGMDFWGGEGVSVRWIGEGGSDGFKGLVFSCPTGEERRVGFDRSGMIKDKGNVRRNSLICEGTPEVFKTQVRW